MKKLFDFIKSFIQTLANFFTGNGQSGSDPDTSGLFSPEVSKQFSTINRKTRRAMEKRLKEAKKKGIRAGLQSEGENPIVPTALIEAERAWVRQLFYTAVVFVGIELGRVQQSLPCAAEALKLGVRELVQRLHQAMYPELAKKLVELELQHSAKANAIAARLEALKNAYNENKAIQLDSMAKHGVFQKDSVIENPWITIVSGLVFWAIDVVAVNQGLEALRLELFVGLGIATALAGFTAIAALKLGVGISRKNSLEAVSGVVIGVAAIALAFLIRYKGTELRLERTETGLGGTGLATVGHWADYTMLGVSLLVYIGTAAIEAARHARREQFSAEGACNDALNESAKLLDESEMAERVHHQQVDLAHADHMACVVGQAYGKHDAQVLEYMNLLAREKGMLALRTAQDDEISIAEEMVKKAVVEGFMEGVANRNPFWPPNNFFSSTLVAGTLLLASCNPAPQAEVCLVFDTTIEPVNQNVFNINGFPVFMTQEVLAIEPKDAPRLGVDVYYMELSELAKPQIINVATLEQGLPAILSVKLDRVDAVMDFVDTLRNLPNTHFKNGNGLERSEICRPLSQMLNRLSESSADNKYLVVFSDAMENAAVNFYSLDIEHLDETGYQQIAEAFVKACPLNNLSSINKIYWVYSPTIYNQGKVLAAQDIFKRYFESYGASVSFIPNF